MMKQAVPVSCGESLGAAERTLQLRGRRSGGFFAFAAGPTGRRNARVVGERAGSVAAGRDREGLTDLLDPWCPKFADARIEALVVD